MGKQQKSTARTHTRTHMCVRERALLNSALKIGEWFGTQRERERDLVITVCSWARRCTSLYTPDRQSISLYLLFLLCLSARYLRHERNRGRGSTHIWNSYLYSTLAKRYNRDRGIRVYIRACFSFAEESHWESEDDVALTLSLFAINDSMAPPTSIYKSKNPISSWLGRLLHVDFRCHSAKRWRHGNAPRFCCAL